MATVRFGPQSPGSRLARTAFALGLLLVAACSNDRPTEAKPGAGPEFTTTSVDCANGCKDTFTDADGTPLTAHAPDVGGFTWSLMEGGGNYAANIRNNAVGVEGLIDGQFNYLVPEIVGLDTVEIEVELFGNPNTMNGSIDVWITLRGTGVPQRGYIVWMRIHHSARRTFVGFSRNDQPLPLSGDSEEVPYFDSGIHKFRGEASGGTLKAYLDGVLVYSINDPSPLPAGNPGFGFSTGIQGYGFEPQVRITSFEVRPCPPTGDPVLDSPAVREGLHNELSLSRPNPDGSGRVERRGYLYQRDDGSYFLLPANDPTGTMCGFSFEDLPVPPTVQGATFIGDYHTHPSKHRELLTGCPNQRPGDVWRANRKARAGGGSEGDWEFTNVRGKSHYIIDVDQKVWRLDANTLPAARKNNPNRWRFPSAAINCLDRA